MIPSCVPIKGSNIFFSFMFIDSNFFAQVSFISYCLLCLGILSSLLLVVWFVVICHRLISNVSHGFRQILTFKIAGSILDGS